MTTRGKSEACRICGGDLQGNQRRWLYTGQNRKGSQTPTDSLRKGSLPVSAHSSPWGSTVSLSSSRSLSLSRGLLTPTKGIDLLCVLTHILEQPVTRGAGQGEFVCGKCVSILEKVFKFDTVIARVRVMSSERLQKLTQERDKIKRWVLNMYEQHNSSVLKGHGCFTEDEGARKCLVGEGYGEMLSDNMAFSEYEWWSEKVDACPHYRKTGKRCHKGKKCECCDSLRVSDSDYESVCGIPRHLPEEAFTTLGLSRDKSSSMPLQWSSMPSVRSSPASLSASCQSLRSNSRTNSVQSMDSLDGVDPFDLPESHSLDSIFKELRGIEGKPVSSPAGSRIPVLSREQMRNGKNKTEATVDLVRVLNFGNGDNGMEDVDVLTELRDDFLPMQRAPAFGKMNLAVKHLREKLIQAQARIRSLEGQLGEADNPVNEAVVKRSKSPKVANLENTNNLIESLSQSLHSRENVIQECVSLIQTLCAEQGLEFVEADTLIRKLSGVMTCTHREREAVLEAQLSEAQENEKVLEKQVESLMNAGRDREKDLITLNTALQCNLDVVNHLRIELNERDRALQEMMKEWDVWKERDSALSGLIQENEDFINRLQEALESSRRDVQALSDSLIGRGLEGGGAEAGLVTQLQEKESLLASSLEDRKKLSATMRQEITRLSDAFKEYETLLQSQRETHKLSITTLSEQFQNTLKDLRDKNQEKKEAELSWKKDNKERAFTEGKLKNNLQKRDKLIEQMLLELEERDGLLTELQRSISSRTTMHSGSSH